MPSSKKYLFIPLSSPGYLFPAIRLAHILERNGHQVKFATTIEYEILLHSQGLDVLGIRNDGLPFLHPSAWFNAAKAPGEMRVLQGAVQDFQPDVIVTSPLVLAAFVLAERYNLPLINIGFAEYLFPSKHGYSEGKTWRLNSLTDYYNRYRATLELPPVPADPIASPLIGNLYLLRNSRELYGPDELPDNVIFVGDLYHELPYENFRLQKFIAGQKNLGKPVIYVQIGRLFEDAALWSHLLGLFGLMDAAFAIDTGRADYLQAGTQVPGNCFLSPFIPLGAIADDIGLVLFTGNSTTAISGILHTKPLLSLPHSADAHEFTSRLIAKRVAVGIAGHAQWSRESIETEIKHLLARGPNAETHFYRDTLLKFDDAMVYKIVTEGLA